VGTAQGASTPAAELGRPPYEVHDVSRDHVGLIELQEVPAVFNERELAFIG
jgi:hypothetical protein